LENLDQFIFHHKLAASSLLSMQAQAASAVATNATAAVIAITESTIKNVP
jgi:hypothetical protein